MNNFVHYNPNPKWKNVDDCTVRAITKALGFSWGRVYAGLCIMGHRMSNMPHANCVWGAYLRKNGFRRHIVDRHGQDIYTVNDFCEDNKEGTYVLALIGHVVCVKDGKIYDTWDSGNREAYFYWTKEI